jgi:hypothetical protein
MGKIAFGDLTSNADVITIGRQNIQAQNGTRQTFATGQLCEQHNFEQLLRAKRDDFVVTSMTFDACLKSTPRQQGHDLRENNFSFMHL